MSGTIALRTLGREDWGTPLWLFDRLNEEFGFDVDACATAENAKLPTYYDLTADALRINWRGTVFMNPPYGRQLNDWMLKASMSACDFGTTVVALVPARTDTAWWHRHAMSGEVRFIRGRLRFAGAKHSAPFPSALVVLGPGGAGPGVVRSMAQRRDTGSSPVLFAMRPAGVFAPGIIGHFHHQAAPRNEHSRGCRRETRGQVNGRARGALGSMPARISHHRSAERPGIGSPGARAVAEISGVRA